MCSGACFQCEREWKELTQCKYTAQHGMLQEIMPNARQAELVIKISHMLIITVWINSSSFLLTSIIEGSTEITKKSLLHNLRIMSLLKTSEVTWCICFCQCV